MENSRKENDSLRNKLVEAETAVQSLEKHCANLKTELETKIAEGNKTNTKLSWYEKQLNKIQSENARLKQNYEYAKTEWENVKTHYDSAVMKNFSLMKEVKQLNEELRNVQKMVERQEEKQEDPTDPGGELLKLLKRGPTEQRQVHVFGQVLIED